MPSEVSRIILAPAQQARKNKLCCMQETSHSGVLITIQDVEAVFKVGKDMKVWMKIYLAHGRFRRRF